MHPVIISTPEEGDEPVSIIIMMGVSGCGKTIIGTILADKLGWKFIKSDSYHSKEDIRKMSNGIPLTDADRWLWLEQLHSLLAEKQAEGIPVVLSSSALRESYRKILCGGLGGCEYVYLNGKYDLIWERMRHRKHFMKPAMLRSQFNTLEEPEDALTVQINQPVYQIIEKIISCLSLEK